MKIDKIQKRLQKLLALSASPNEAEASLAMQKCNELMEKYQIRTIDVNEETHEVGIKTSRVQGYTKRHATWESKLAASICSCFDAEAIIHRKKDSWGIVFISSLSEHEIIVDLFKRLRRTISKLSKSYADNNVGNSLSLQKSYAFGMIDTIHGRLMTIYSNLPETTELVVFKKEAINNKIQDMFGTISRQRIAPPTNRDAFIKGARDGRSVNINRAVKHREQREIA
ncbi:MAG: hypothetical protein DRO67_00205 [Candidatus Asgardarchaeum californiense]|nr:MAG: hypothetical protein DRO67_00205 [Candidatus Asgardarchaeum californiense]